MGGRNKDLLYAIVDKRFDVFLGQAFEQFFIAGFADAFSTAILFGAQYPEIHPCRFENFRCGNGDLFRSWVIAGVAAGEIQDFHFLGKGFYGKAFCPIRPLFSVFTKGVAFADETSDGGADGLDRSRKDTIFRGNPA